MKLSSFKNRQVNKKKDTFKKYKFGVSLLANSMFVLQLNSYWF